MITCFIAFCCVLVVAILKFEGVSVKHYVRVDVKARSIIELLKGWFKK
jgi:hypothetical protein